MGEIVLGMALIVLPITAAYFLILYVMWRR